MKVTAVVTFKFHDELTKQPIQGSGRYMKELAVSASPAGLTGLIVNVDSFPVHCQVTATTWSEPLNAFVIMAVATEGPHVREKLGKDKTWQYFPE